MDIKDLVDNKELIEVARKAIEDFLIELRDSRISQPFRGNGLVVNEADGSPSHTIRMGPEAAMVIGLKAIVKHLENQSGD